MREPLVILNADACEETGGVSIPAHWRWPALLIVSLIVATIGFFWQTAWLVGKTWYSSRTFSHGFLVLPLAVYLVWIRRHRIVASRPKPNYWALPLLTIVAFAWLLANLGDVRIVQQFALVSILIVTVWIVLGSVVTRALWFPLAFLFFAVPFGESLISPLQDFTARVAVTGLRLSNVPVILEHRTISVPSGPWVVAEACSGIRYLISSFVLGLIYASLVYRSRKRRILFVLASIGVPIVANGIRAYGIIMLAYLTDNRLAVGVDHIVYGWIFFTGLQLLLFGLGLKWREPTHVAMESKSSSGANAAARKEENSPSAVSTAAISALILIAAAPLLSARLWSRPAVIDAVRQPIVAVSAPWHPVSTYDMSWAPHLEHVASPFVQSYASGGSRVDVFVAIYPQSQPVELVSSYNLVSKPKTWYSVAGGFRSATIDSETISVRWYLLQSALGPRIEWIWYRVAGQYTADSAKVKFLQAKARLLGRPATAAMIAVGADYPPDASNMDSELQDFLSHTSLSAAIP